MDDPQLERTGGEDTADSINPQTLLIIAATVIMFLVLIFGWVFAGRILDKLDSGIDSIATQIAKATTTVVDTGKIVVQEVLKGTGNIINQISAIVDAFDTAIEPLLSLVAKATEDLLQQMITSISSIISTLNTLGQTINDALLQMITILNIAITTAINDTLGFIANIFSPFFQ